MFESQTEKTTSRIWTADNRYKSVVALENAKLSQCMQDATLNLDTFVVKATNGENRFGTLRPFEFLLLQLRISSPGT